MCNQEYFFEEDTILVKTPRKQILVVNAFRSGGDSAYLELAAQKNLAVAAHFLRQTSKRLPSQSSIEYADADPLPEILPSRSHTETAV
ncbi:hypothetical protein QYM36_006059 [Artemia franciscana]|uniref:Uncharacterized protein n=1 Tax=Artemia franciscana TaxID=6661 RepID=A0AA88HVN0_ARTSF|nr:hypothetical protein QYM36_006059 [Artemia franciscana]